MIKHILHWLFPQRQFIARAPRIPVHPLHRVLFKDDNSYVLANISTKGMALLANNAKGKTMGEIVNGSLMLNDTTWPIRFRVSHFNGSLIGCEFLKPDARLVAAIEDYFKMEILAFKLRPVDPRFLQQPPAGQSFWFTDGSASELFFIWNEGKLLEFHFSFLGYYLEAKMGGKLKSGAILSDKEENTVRKTKSADLLQMDTEVDPIVLTGAKQILQNMRDLQPEHRLALEAWL